MPTRRTKLNRGYRRRINNAAIAAWRVADEDALHDALGLTPGLIWQCSPLPREFFPFGVTEGGGELHSNFFKERERYQEALDIQRSLVEVAGWPDCRAQIRERISELQESMDYDAKRCADIESGKYVVPVVCVGDLERLKRDQKNDAEHMAWLREALRLEEESPGQGKWREACAS